MEKLLNKKISRRSFITASAGIAGLGALAATTGISADWLGSRELDEQQKFLSDILNRYTGHSDKIRPQYIELFTQSFAQAYGVVDYKALFAGPIGEFRLIKFFLRSVFRAA